MSQRFVAPTDDKASWAGGTFLKPSDRREGRLVLALGVTFATAQK